MKISYDYSVVQQTLSRRTLAERGTSLWRYSELLPISEEKSIVTLGEGGTPLVASRRLGPALGLGHLHFKDETRLPTGSLKDRCAAVSISKALESGVGTVVVSSSGNGASAMAAYSARAGIGCYVFVPSDAAANKLIQSMAYGAKVVRVSGGVTEAADLADLVGREKGWPNVSTAAAYNPYSQQGQKTGAYEIDEQHGWTPPDWVVHPEGSRNFLEAVSSLLLYLEPESSAWRPGSSAGPPRT